MESFDVVVVGAGLAGLQTALRLGERKFRILLIDRKPALNRSIHTTGIFVRRTLEDFDLPDDCLGPPVRNVTLYSPARRSLDLASPHDEFRVGRMAQLYERLLQRCIRARVEWSPATRYIDHTQLNDELIMRIETEGHSRSVRTRYIVGADGATSQIGAALGLDANLEWIVGVEEVLENVPLAGPPRFHCFLDPHIAPGYLAWIVHDGEQIHLGVGGYPSRFDPLRALRQFRNSVDDIVDLSRAKLIERRGGRIPVGGVLRRIANDQGLLVGDAAGAVSPLTAGGLDPCLRLSAFAANVIGDYLESANHAVLSSYSGDLFRARFVSRLWMRRVLAAVQSPVLIELGCALFRLPVFNSFAWHVFFGRGSFPDLQRPTIVEQTICSTG